MGQQLPSKGESRSRHVTQSHCHKAAAYREELALTRKAGTHSAAATPPPDYQKIAAANTATLRRNHEGGPGAFKNTMWHIT